VAEVEIVSTSFLLADKLSGNRQTSDPLDAWNIEICKVVLIRVQRRHLLFMYLHMPRDDRRREYTPDASVTRGIDIYTVAFAFEIAHRGYDILHTGGIIAHVVGKKRDVAFISSGFCDPRLKRIYHKDRSIFLFEFCDCLSMQRNLGPGPRAKCLYGFRIFTGL
jgi:hypothetical protein